MAADFRGRAAIRPAAVAMHLPDRCAAMLAGMKMTPPWLAAAAAAAATAALLQACGGDGGGETPAPPAAPPPALPAGRVSAASPVDAACAVGGTGTVYINAEVEPMLARATGNGEHLVAVWQQDRWSNGGARAMVSATSLDGGRSWTRVLHAMSRCGGAAAGSAGDFERASDPWVDIGSDGTVHVMALAISGESFTGSSVSAMLASRSTDGGLSFSPPQVLARDAGAAFFNDKNTLTVDTLDASHVYAVWDRLEASGDGPTLLARSTDAGLNWQPVREIYRPAAAPGGSAQTIGNRIVVLPGGPSRGVLVNVFTEIQVSGAVVNNRVRVIRSTDQGSSWGAPVTVAEHRGVGTRDTATGNIIRDGSIIPAVAAAADGTLWLAWQDSRFSGGQHDGIALSRSTDGGLSWSTPVAANGSPAVAAFTPTLQVRADGLLAVMYLDLRPNTPATDTLLAAAWLATTRDGAAFAETVVWNPFDMTHAPNARGLFLGDYFGLVSVGNEFVPLLALPSTDTSNRTDTYLLRVLPSAAARPQPLASGRVQALSATEEREFRRRQAAFTQRVMERRVANWGARVGWRTPDAAPARR